MNQFQSENPVQSRELAKSSIDSQSEPEIVAFARTCCESCVLYLLRATRLSTSSFVIEETA
jgi:hypothetical protein